jgi:hypothetical protein
MKATVVAQTLMTQRVVIVTPEGRRYDLGVAPARFKWLWPKMWLYRCWHLPLRKRAIRKAN